MTTPRGCPERRAGTCSDGDALDLRHPDARRTGRQKDRSNNMHSVPPIPERTTRTALPNLYSGSGQSCGGFAATDQAFLSAGAAPVCKLGPQSGPAQHRVSAQQLHQHEGFTVRRAADDDCHLAVGCDADGDFRRWVGLAEERQLEMLGPVRVAGPDAPVVRHPQ
jgi:hypothetical protein